MNIMIVGVGGQGTLLASKLLGHVLLNEGHDVKVSEVHGMSQRGGSVVTYVRFGKKIYSPVIDRGEADIILSFEQLEAARWFEYLRKDGLVITNTQRLNPMPVITGIAEYPEGLVDKMKSSGANIIAEDFLAVAEKAGSSKAVNIALLGCLSKHFEGIPKEKWDAAIDAVVPEKFRRLNHTAFDLGREL